MTTALTPLTEDEAIAVECLAQVTYPVASWDKRFNRNLNRESLSDKERAQVWRLFIKYRRQISHARKAELLAKAENLAAPDFRKQNAAMLEMARIERMRRRLDEATMTSTCTVCGNNGHRATQCGWN